MTAAQVITIVAAIVALVAAISAVRDALWARRAARWAERSAEEAFFSKLNTSIDSSTARILLAQVRQADQTATRARRRSGGAK